MTNSSIGCSKPRVLWSLRVLLAFTFLLIPQFAFPHKASAAVIASDDFNRADGGVGAGWTAISDGGMSIASQQLTGTAGVLTGDIWAANTFASDQYSAVQVTSTQLTGGLWVGPAVRVQNGGLGAYVGIYSWNNGSPVLELFKRSGGNWAQLGGSYSSGPLAAGTQLEVAAVGNTISFMENGVQRIGVSDGSFTGGAPGMMAYGNATADNWSGGNAASYSVGGTVSALSGTVVLQDNGGDNLSVGANGSFMFATPVASGVAKVKLPFALTLRLSPPLSCSTTVPDSPETVPPTE